MGRLFVDTNEMDWENGLDVISHMTEEFRENLGPKDKLEDVYVKYHQKTLRVDPETKRRIDYIWLEGGYRDLTNAYHDSVEECLVLTGSLWLDGEGEFTAGDYFWRPPGFVHAAGTTEGFTALLSLQGIDAAEASDPTSRRIRPDDEAGTNQKIRDPEAAVGPRGWVLRQPTALLPWVPGKAWARCQGQLDGFDVEHMDVKVLSENRISGGQSLLIRLHPGYRQSFAGSHQTAVEFFITEGSADLGDVAMPTGAYLYRAPGQVEEPLSSAGGATLFLKADGLLDWRSTR